MLCALLLGALCAGFVSASAPSPLTGWGRASFLAGAVDAQVGCWRRSLGTALPPDPCRRRRCCRAGSCLPPLLLSTAQTHPSRPSPRRPSRLMRRWAPCLGRWQRALSSRPQWQWCWWGRAPRRCRHSWTSWRLPHPPPCGCPTRRTRWVLQLYVFRSGSRGMAQDCPAEICRNH